MSIAFVILAALTVDFMLGDPRHFHPISGFGIMANWLEKKLNSQSSLTTKLIIKDQVLGLISVIILVSPVTVLLTYINTLFTNQSLHIVEILILFYSLGSNSLRLHGMWVLKALQASDITTARTKTSWIVSRDTSHLNQSDLSKATIESILENGNDAIFAPLFWFIVGGVPGVVIYRLVNTLDAMWGYKSTRYLHFGWAAARLDDVLNFIPAHLTAICYAITGKFFTAMRCWLKQAYQWKSLNAGIVMSTGAGALALKLGGSAQYQGVESQRIILGKGDSPEYKDIKRAINLVQRTLVLWVIVIFILSHFEYI